MISIIIPTYNEEKFITQLIDYLEAEIRSEEAEIIISDGGSSDKTLQILKNREVKVLNSPKKGRAFQLNYGAKFAKGEFLYFLHADTFPPLNFLQEIEQAISEGWKSGCFRLKFDSDNPILKFYSWYTRFNIDVFRFGDQSLYVKKEIFGKIGGYRENLLVMEDQQIVRDLKKVSPFKVMNGATITSSRKYKKVGVIKLQLIFFLIVILYYLGVGQKTIVDFYKTAIN